MDRRNLFLSALLIVQIGLVAFFFWPSGNSNAAATALISGATEDQVTGLTVTGGEQTVELTKGDNGWVLTNYGDYPADTVKVTDLISKVLAIDTSRLVASTTGSQERLQVTADKFVKKVVMTTADNKSQTLYIGTSPNLRATNVRLDGSNNVYLTGEVSGADLRTDVGGWADLAYFQAPTADAQAVTIANANGTIDFSRVNTDTWQLDDLAAGEVFLQNNFSSILTRLNGINMVEPVGKEAQPAFGLDAPSATVTVVTKPANGDAKTMTLAIGAKDEGGTNYYAKSSESDYYVKIASFSGDQFVNDTRERYLQPPPTPDASSTLTGTNEITAATPITSFAPFAPAVEPSGATPLSTTDTVSATDSVAPESPLATPAP